METAIRQCPECGIDFSMPAWLYELYRLSGESYHCPQGHKMYTPGALEQARANAVKFERWYNGEVIAVNKLSNQISALRGVITKLKKQLDGKACGGR